jgi:methionyl aminopeptidase
MTVRRQQELAGLRRVGRVVRRAIDRMAAALRPGITTAELDAIGAGVLAEFGARSAPQIFYDFPGVATISINDEAVHGIPGARVVRPGDLVKIDVTAELDGYLADACTTVCVPPVSQRAEALVRAARSALEAAIAAAKVGVPVNHIGRAVETDATRHGVRILRSLSGHGTGRRIHEEPTVHNFFVPGNKALLREGLVLAIEPILAESTDDVVTGSDGWTISTADGSLSAQFEHTVVVSKSGPILLTA